MSYPNLSHYCPGLENEQDNHSAHHRCKSFYALQTANSPLTVDHSPLTDPNPLTDPTPPLTDFFNPIASIQLMSF